MLSKRLGSKTSMKVRPIFARFDWLWLLLVHFCRLRYELERQGIYGGRIQSLLALQKRLVLTIHNTLMQTPATTVKDAIKSWETENGDIRKAPIVKLCCVSPPLHKLDTKFINATLPRCQCVSLHARMCFGGGVCLGGAG